MRLKSEDAPDSQHAGIACLRHPARAPVRAVSGGFQRLHDDCLDLVITDAPRSAAAGFIHQPR